MRAGVGSRVAARRRRWDETRLLSGTEPEGSSEGDEERSEGARDESPEQATGGTRDQRGEDEFIRQVESGY